ncbi:hypothetical protein GGR54DRAFT_639914 [Hypoxylon sp. NC1633]|nr:hypothetical protein GGR54DRAFT_639914 [Hypoxylon sp. NC1633]
MPEASRIKNGIRIVRITNRTARLRKRRQDKRAGRAKAKPVAADSTAQERKKGIVGSPTVESRQPKRAVGSSAAETTLEPRTARFPKVQTPVKQAHTPFEIPDTPFHNPDLDQPLQWSPGMFEQEIDRYNWTWSSWDSPSREIIDVSWHSSEDSQQPRDPLALFPTYVRDLLREIMAARQNPEPSDRFTDSVTDYTEQTYTEQAYTEQGVTEQGHTEQAPTEQAYTERSQTEQAPTEQSQTEQATTEQAHTERAHTPFEVPSTPFQNPDLSRPLHWSPGMFKQEIDRYNWTWSSWDSPSQEIIDVSYHSEDSLARDPFARFPPHVRKLLRQIMALKQDPVSSARSTDSLAADTVRYEEVDYASSFSSGRLSSDKPARSESSDFSSWVDLDCAPWPPQLLEMCLDSERHNEWCERRGIGKHSPLSSRSASEKDMSSHSKSSSDSPYMWSPYKWPASPYKAVNSAEELRDGEDLNSSPVSKPPGTPAGAQQHFRSLQGLASPPTEAQPETTLYMENWTEPNLILPPLSGPPFDNYQANFTVRRQLPSAIATEPRQSVEESGRGSGFGWKSIACVAAAAATIGAGLAYAWFSG